LIGAPAARAADDYTINVIVPLTGGAAFVGGGQKDTLEALAAIVNKDGGIPNHKLVFFYHDDQSSPQVAVQFTNEALQAKPAVIMGSSIVAMCLAMAPLMTSTTHYCLSPAIHPQPGSNTFSASADSVDQVAVVMRHFRMKGWTKIAALQTTDASGQDGDKAIDAVLAYPENKGVMQKVALEHFNPTDITVAAQIEKIKTSGTQVLIMPTDSALRTLGRLRVSVAMPSRSSRRTKASSLIGTSCYDNDAVHQSSPAATSASVWQQTIRSGQTSSSTERSTS
jgi:branched-chain amino acid transport system substrate-binding protein